MHRISKHADEMHGVAYAQCQRPAHNGPVAQLRLMWPVWQKQHGAKLDEGNPANCQR
jgi:hypothetical protein